MQARAGLWLTRKPIRLGRGGTAMAPDPISPPDAHLGHWLRLVANHASHHLGRALAARGVTAAEWGVMRALYDAGPVAPSALAARIGLTRGAVTRLIDRLRAKALVVRAHGRGDRRFQIVALTGSGAKLVPVLAAIADASDAAVFAALPAETRATITAALRAIARDAGETSCSPAKAGAQ